MYKINNKCFFGLYIAVFHLPSINAKKSGNPKEVVTELRTSNSSSPHSNPNEIPKSDTSLLASLESITT